MVAEPGRHVRDGISVDLQIRGVMIDRAGRRPQDRVIADDDVGPTPAEIGRSATGRTVTTESRRRLPPYCDV